MKKIGITGGTGFVGRHLTALLIRNGYEVVVFTTGIPKKRKKQHVSYSHWDPEARVCDIDVIKTLEAVVHLAGAGIADKRWKEKRKKEIISSRVKSTEFLVAMLNAHGAKCQVFIGASAIGFYGPDSHYSSLFTEDAPAFNDFLGNACKAWERASEPIPANIRRVVLRFGIVLGKGGGAMQQFVKPMSMGVMPVLGSGGQVVSWIEMHDLVRLIQYAMEHERVSGIYNAVAPGHVSHRQLMHTIAAAMRGIKIPVHVPSALLKILLGEMSTELLKSCTVSADKIIEAGFVFDHPDIESAVKASL